MKTFIIFLIAVCASGISIAYACKARSAPETYPITELLNTDNLVVVVVDKAANVLSAQYPYTDKFEGTVVKSYKGSLNVGQKIIAGHLNESALSVCPVLFEQGQGYLMVLKQKSNLLRFSRFNYHANIKAAKYPIYHQQLSGK